MRPRHGIDYIVERPMRPFPPDQGRKKLEEDALRTKALSSSCQRDRNLILVFLGGNFTACSSHVHRGFDRDFHGNS